MMTVAGAAYAADMPIKAPVDQTATFESRFACGVFQTVGSNLMYNNTGNVLNRNPTSLTIADCMDKETGLYVLGFGAVPLSKMDDGLEGDVLVGRRFKMLDIFNVDIRAGVYEFRLGGVNYTTFNSRAVVSLPFVVGPFKLRAFGGADYQHNHVLGPNVDTVGVFGGMAASYQLTDRLRADLTGETWYYPTSWFPNQNATVYSLTGALGYQLNKNVEVGPRAVVAWCNILTTNCDANYTIGGFLKATW
ncbi:MAG TPA: hypothetical protein VGP13_01140 [Candidatus Paceibacterota bacterium]|nr:hypothetical protein [Candidatus Paceibacterota bacterium]